MAQQLQYPDLTPAQFEFELRDHRKMAYNEYLRFQEERKQHRAAFEQAQAKRSPLSRWWHTRIQHFRDRCDEHYEQKLRYEVNFNE